MRASEGESGGSLEFLAVESLRVLLSLDNAQDHADFPGSDGDRISVEVAIAKEGGDDEKRSHRLCVAGKHPPPPSPPHPSPHPPSFRAASSTTKSSYCCPPAYSKT